MDAQNTPGTIEPDAGGGTQGGTANLVAQYRAQFPRQPRTITVDLMQAIIEFERALPGWWWSICVCSRSRDASCGPDAAGPDHHLLQHRLFDEGFHCDHEGTLADALRDVMGQALAAKAAPHD